MKRDNTAYWCTCSDDPAKCLGCAIERLVEQVLGETGTRFLTGRIYKLVKPAQSGKRRS